MRITTKKVAWILPQQYSPVAIAAYKRLTWQAVRNLQITVIDRPELFDRYSDVFFGSCVVVYAAIYAPFQQISRFLEHHSESQLFWLTNEYNLNPNGAVYRVFRKRGYGVIANYVREAFSLRWDHVTSFHTVNLNALLVERDVPRLEKRFGLVYYGGFRPDRTEYFRRYFDGTVEVWLSTSTKNRMKFAQAGVQVHYIQPLQWRGALSALGRFRYSLYIEDKYTHTHYNHPANRFYEALTNHVVQFFDANCKNTFETAGYEVPDFYWVESATELKEKMAKADQQYENYLSEQRELWIERAMAEKNAVLRKLADVLGTRVTNPELFGEVASHGS